MRNLYLKYIISLVVGLLVVISSVCADEQPPPAMEICKEQSQCNLIGTQRSWPDQGFDSSTVVFSNLIFNVRLPNTLDKVSIGFGKSQLYAVWFADQRVAFGIEEVPNEKTSTDYQKILEEKSKSSWKPIDIFRIIFSNKPTDKEPENAYEKYLWRTAFFYKAIVYKAPDSASIFKRGPWTAYAANINGPTKYRLTIITHSDIDNRYLTIRDNGLSIDFLKKIIASIQLNENI